MGQYPAGYLSGLLGHLIQPGSCSDERSGGLEQPHHLEAYSPQSYAAGCRDVAKFSVVVPDTILQARF